MPPTHRWESLLDEWCFLSRGDCIQKIDIIGLFEENILRQSHSKSYKKIIDFAAALEGHKVASPIMMVNLCKSKVKPRVKIESFFNKGIDFREVLEKNNKTKYIFNSREGTQQDP